MTKNDKFNQFLCKSFQMLSLLSMYDQNLTLLLICCQKVLHFNKIGPNCCLPDKVFLFLDTVVSSYSYFLKWLFLITVTSWNGCFLLALVCDTVTSWYSCFLLELFPHTVGCEIVFSWYHFPDKVVLDIVVSWWCYSAPIFGADWKTQS